MRAAPTMSAARANYLLLLLTLVGTVNSLDRGIFGVVLQSIKAEMHVSDTVMGLVAGLPFAFFYAFMGVPIAYLADRYSRRNIIVIGMAFWSVMTCLTGFVANVWQLAVTRFLMGAGEASSVAPSNAMVADLYPKKKRPFVLGILWTGLSLGAVAALAGGGWINQQYGWRAAFIAAGVPGIILAILLILTTKEPVRGASDKVKVSLDVSTLRATIGFLAKSKAYIYVLTGGVLGAIGLSSQGSWSVPFLIRVHHFSSAEAGGFLGLIRFTSLPGYLLGGYLATRLGQWDERWRVWVPALGCLLGAPAGILFLFSDVRWIMFTGSALMSFFGAMQPGPLAAICQTVAKIRMRAVSVAVFIFFLNFVGNIGPVGVGYLNDRMSAAYGPEAIRYSLLWLGTLVWVGAGLFIWIAARYFVQDTERALEA